MLMKMESQGNGKDNKNVLNCKLCKISMAVMANFIFFGLSQGRKVK